MEKFLIFNFMTVGCRSFKHFCYIGCGLQRNLLYFKINMSKVKVNVA